MEEKASIPEIYEIRIRKTEELSPSAKQEVIKKLEDKGPDFDYRGYAKINYAKNSPLRIVSVDPIEGTVVTYFQSLIKNLEL